MKVTVEMTAEEFESFRVWQRQDSFYTDQLAKTTRIMNALAKKVDYAIEPIPGKPHKYKIADHDHADDLFMLCGEILEETSDAAT